MLLEVETSLLGTLIQSPDWMADLYIQPQELACDERHKLILATIVDCYEQYDTFNLLFLAERSGANINKIGGITYLSQLERSVIPNVTHLAYYQSIIRKAYIQRESAEVIKNMYEATKDGQEPDPEFMAQANERLEELSDLGSKNKGSGVVDMKELLDGHVEELNERRMNNGMMGSRTLSREVDKLTGGHRPEDFEVVAARPSMGKTAYIVNDAIESKKDGKVPLILSAEMTKKQIMERLICSLANLDNNKMKTGMMDSKDWERYNYAANIIEQGGFLIDDTAGMDVPYIRGLVKKLIKQFPNLIVYVDYLQLIKGGRSFPSRREEVDYVSRSFKLLARKYKITVVALAQLNRGVEDRQDKRPMMSDIKESGGIEQDADIITFLYRDDYYHKDSEEKGIAEIIIAKGRNVGIGTVKMLFKKEIGKFIDIDRGHHGKKAS